MIKARLTWSVFPALFISLLCAALLVAGDVSSSLKIGANKPEAMPYAQAITSLLDRLVIEKPRSHHNLTIFPISWKGAADPVEYATLEASTRDKTVEISELEQASVPRLKLINKNKKPLFLMTGEVLTGAKQDRILAHDILVGPGQKELIIPVYCVERGRWRMKSEKFAPAQNIAALKVRGAAAQKLAQREVWRQVGEVNVALGQDASGSMQESFQDEKSMQERKAYGDALLGLSKNKTYVGVVAAINGEVTNVDIMSSPALFFALWPKLLEAYALEAMQERSADKFEKAAAAEARAFVSTVFDARFRELENPGQGAEFMIEADDVSGSALVHEGKVIHLALFPFEGPKEPAEVPTALPPQRWVEETPQQIQVNPPVQQAVISEGAYGRSGSFKPEGVEFDIKNPENKKIK